MLSLGAGRVALTRAGDSRLRGGSMRRRFSCSGNCIPPERTFSVRRDWGHGEESVLYQAVRRLKKVEDFCHRLPANPEKAGVGFFFSLDSDT